MPLSCFLSMSEDSDAPNEVGDHDENAPMVDSGL
jgi:hypothetical protein